MHPGHDGSGSGRTDAHGGRLLFLLLGSADRNSHAQRPGQRQRGLHLQDGEHDHDGERLVGRPDQRRSPGNVFWQVGSSATLGTGTSFAGNILAMASITVTTGVRVNGRTLARNGAVTLDTNAVTAARPDVGGHDNGGRRADHRKRRFVLGHRHARRPSRGGHRHSRSSRRSTHPLVWANPSFLTFGDLNLLGLTNPVRRRSRRSRCSGVRWRRGRRRTMSSGARPLRPAGRTRHLGLERTTRIRSIDDTTSSGAARCSSRPTPAEAMTSPRAGSARAQQRTSPAALRLYVQIMVAIGGLGVVHSIRRVASRTAPARVDGVCRSWRWSPARSRFVSLRSRRR